MSFFANLSGHVDEVAYDAEAVERQFLGRLEALVAEFADHLTQATFSGQKVPTVDILARPAPEAPAPAPEAAPPAPEAAPAPEAPAPEAPAATED
jgi:hypothetical protein